MKEAEKPTRVAPAGSTFILGLHRQREEVILEECRVQGHLGRSWTQSGPVLCKQEGGRDSGIQPFVETLVGGIPWQFPSPHPLTLL